MVFDESVPSSLRNFRSKFLKPLDLTSLNKLLVQLKGGLPHTFQSSKFKQFDVFNCCYDLPFKSYDCSAESGRTEERSTLILVTGTSHAFLLIQFFESKQENIDTTLLNF